MKQTATLNYRLEQAATVLAAMVAAALVGWAVALAFGLWGEHLAARLVPWKPFALASVKLDAGGTSVAAPVATGNTRLVGVAGDRAYFMSGSAPNARSLSLLAGDILPSGEKLLRIDRDGVVIASAGGEQRIPVLADRPDAKGKSLATIGMASANTAGCRLAGADRGSAIFIESGVVKALAAERATFARMFEPVASAGGGIRARGTGGTTAMFAIDEGDLLLRADGTPLRTGEAIAGEILARLDRGASVVVEGERKGVPRRWVYAPSSCNVPASNVSKSSG